MSATIMWVIGTIVTALIGLIIPMVASLYKLYSRVELHSYRIDQLEDSNGKMAISLDVLKLFSARIEEKLDQLMIHLDKDN